MLEFNIFETLATSTQACSENELYKALHQKNIARFGNSREYFDYVETLARRVIAAEEKYKEDRDIEALIHEYEFAFIESKPPLILGRNERQ